MTQIFRILIAYPAFFLLQNIIKRFSIFAGLIIFICIIIFASEYVNSFFSIDTFKNINFSDEEASSEAKVLEVVVKKGDTLGAILHRQNLPNSDIQALVKSATEQKITSQLKIGQKLVF